MAHGMYVLFEVGRFARGVSAGGAVSKYEGRRLVVTIASEVAIGLRRPPIGKCKRRVQFAAGQLKVTACAELPDEQHRHPLQLASSTKIIGPGKRKYAPKWSRYSPLCHFVCPMHPHEGLCLWHRMMLQFPGDCGQEPMYMSAAYECTHSCRCATQACNLHCTAQAG